MLRRQVEPVRQAVDLECDTGLERDLEHLLEVERARGFISQAAYMTGREIQQAFEVSVASGSNWNDAGVSNRGSTDGQALRGVRIPQERVSLSKDRVDAVGRVGARLLDVAGDLVGDALGLVLEFTHDLSPMAVCIGSTGAGERSFRA